MSVCYLFCKQKFDLLNATFKTKRKEKNWDLMTEKSFCKEKDTVIWKKLHTTEWQNILPNTHPIDSQILNI